VTTKTQPKLLLIESDSDERRSLTNLLSASGFDVLAAVDYEAAAKSMEKGVPELAVVSTRLSEGPSGFVALRAFKAKGGRSVVALLPEDNFEEAVSAFRLGAADVLVKPPRVAELVGALRRGLGEAPQIDSDAGASEGSADSSGSVEGEGSA
jgi:DNA-binding response OmpR family regulator